MTIYSYRYTKVLTDMLKEFGSEIWTADGTDVVAALGFDYPTRMAVIRLALYRSPAAVSSQPVHRLAIACREAGP